MNRKSLHFLLFIFFQAKFFFFSGRKLGTNKNIKRSKHKIFEPVFNSLINKCTGGQNVITVKYITKI